MKTLLKTLWLALVATTIVACDKPAPTPDPVPPVTDNVMTYGAETIEFKSILVCDTLANQNNEKTVIVFASVEAGITTVKEMVRQNGAAFVHKFIAVAVPPKNINKQIDVMGSDTYFFANYSTLCPDIREVKPRLTTMLSAGTIKISWSEGNAMVAEFDLTLKSDDSHLTGKITAPYTPTPPVSQITNAIEFDGADKTEFKSVVFYEETTKLYIYASATPNITTFDAMQNVPNLMIMVGYDDMNKTIDLMTENNALFGMANNTGIGSEITACGSGMFPDVKAGTFVYTYDKPSGAFSATINLTAKESGKILKTNVTGTYTPKPVAETDVMKFNDSNFPILVKYYEPTELGTKFYVSPFDTPASEIASCAHVAKIFVGTAYIDGEKHDITKLTDGFGFAYFNIISSVDVLIEAGDLKGATGDFSIANNGGGNFTLQYNIVIDGNTISGQAENLFTQMDVSPTPGAGNFYSLYSGGVESSVGILSVVLDKTANGGANWDIYISGEKDITTVEGMKASEKPIIIRTTEALMDGQEQALKETAAISLTYDGVKYDKTSLTGKYDEGYLTGSYTDELGIMFTVYKDDFSVEGEFLGSVTVIK